MLNKKILINIVILISIIPLFFIRCIFFRSNEVPVINSLFILEEYDLFIDDTLHIVCSAYDPDEDLIEYTWTCSQGGDIIVSSNDTATIIANDTLINVNCRVKDPSGGSTSDSMQISLANRSTPIIDSLYVIGETCLANIGDQLHLVCEAHHPNGNLIEYTWNTNSGILTVNEDQAILEITNYAPINVTCSVNDNYYGVVERSLSFDIPATLNINGVLKANHSQSDSLLGNVPFAFKNIHYWGSGIKTSPTGSFSISLDKPIEDLTLQVPGYYVNSSEMAYEKNIPLSDIKKVCDSNESIYELEINLDLPSTNNFYVFMPLAIGNTWTFDSGYGWVDEYRTQLIDGTEVWEITDMNENGDTLIMDVRFGGIKYVTSFWSSDTTWYEEYHSHKQYKLYKHNQFIYHDTTLYSDGYEGNLIPVANNVFQNGLQYKFDTMIDSIEYERPILCDPESDHPQLQLRYSRYKVKYGIGSVSIWLDYYENEGNFLGLQTFVSSE